MNEELKPCPFCGGEAGVGRCYTSKGYYFVNCTECNATVDQFNDDPKTRETAIAEWNNRTE